MWNLSIVLLIAISVLPVAGMASREILNQSPRNAVIEKLADRVVAGGNVSVIVRIDDNGAFLPGRSTNRDKLRQAQDEFLKKLGDGVSDVRRFKAFPFIAYKVDSKGLAAMKEDDQIISVQENAGRKLHLAQSAPMIGAPAVWDTGLTGQGQYVAVIDSGVDSTHFFLKDSVAIEACLSGYYGESVCPNGQDYQFGPGAAVPCSLDGCSHGTHVSGIIAGNMSKMHGIAKGAKIVALQVASRMTNSDDCGDEPAPCMTFWDADILSAMDLVYDLKQSDGYPIAAVNMSLGGADKFTQSCDAQWPLYRQSVEWLKNIDIATVVSSGNESYRDGMSAPACLSQVVSVGSVCDTTNTGDCPQGPGQLADSSNVSNLVSLLAPGAMITSAVPGTGYASWSGTSMAAPHVAGAWALMKQHKPAATVSDILAELRNNATLVSDERSGGSVNNMRSLDLGFLENNTPLLDTSIRVSFEEPAANTVVSGVGNIRGWAVSADGISYVEYYIDGKLKGRIPYGGSRPDVGNKFPEISGSEYSGYAKSFTFPLLSEGLHTFKIKVVSNSGKYNERENRVTVTKFHKVYFGDPDAMDISSSSVSRDATGIILRGVKVEGQSYDIRMEWSVPAQQFGIVEIK
jgi:subtilisin family serine protease